MVQNGIQRFEDESVENRREISLQTIRELLQFRTSEVGDLRLDENCRQLLFTGHLKKSPTNPTEITALLFDHAILFTRINWNQKKEKIEIYRRHIPLELLLLPKTKQEVTHTSCLKPSFLTRFIKDNSENAVRKETWPITFCHLGKDGYELTLYASCQEDQEKWMEVIGAAYERLRGYPEIFNPTIISRQKFSAPGKINCAITFDHGRKVLYGTENGIYFSSCEKYGLVPEKVLNNRKVTQIDILEECHLLLVLSNKTLQSYCLTSLDSDEFSVLQNPKTLHTNCSFFKAGVCMEKYMVSCVKSGLLSTTIKVFEMNHVTTNEESIDCVRNQLELFKEFYVPRKTYSVHFLKSKICIAGPQGFEVISLKTLETQMLLDKTDTSLEFALMKSLRPIHIQRIGEEFLLNYSEFSFFVNRNGKRTRHQLRFDWAGSPQSFVLRFPWIFAFEPKFIELRNIETGATQIVPHKNIRMLYSNFHEV